MLRQLEIEALQADLAAVRDRLAARTKRQDPIGFRQFRERQVELEQRLAELHEQGAGGLRRQDVGLIFGGTPVIGSRGIDADFASRALKGFQLVISAKLASREGPLGRKGPIRGRSRAQMLVSNIARGSFGFVLEQASSDDGQAGSLSETITEVVDLIHTAYAGDEEKFEAATTEFDRRLLNSVQNFFRVLHSAGATMRVVSDEQHFLLQHDDVARARGRVDRVTVNDEAKTFAGRLLFVPSSKKFELYIGGGDSISGSIESSLAQEIMTESGMPREGIADTWCVVRVKVRRISMQGHTPTFNFTLLKIIHFGASRREELPL